MNSQDFIAKRLYTLLRDDTPVCLNGLECPRCGSADTLDTIEEIKIAFTRTDFLLCDNCRTTVGVFVDGILKREDT